MKTGFPKYALAAIIYLLMLPAFLQAQEVIFFDEGTDNNFYDQGIVNVNDLGESTFEHTYPPGGSPTLWNDKVPCSTNAYMGSTSLEFDYFSSENGSWLVRIHQKNWGASDISSLDSIRFYIYSETGLPKSALPLIGVLTNSGTSDMDTLAKYNSDVPAAQWTPILYPLDQLLGSFDLTAAKAILLGQSEFDNSSRVVLIDQVTAYNPIDVVPAVTDFTAGGYDSHADLQWSEPLPDLNYKIYASFDDGETFELRKQLTETSYLDFVPEEGKNKTVIYRVVASLVGKDSDPVDRSVEIRDFTDDELLEMMQWYCFRYFWEGAHQASGASLERSNGNGRTVASGATGFGLMAMIVAHEREFRPREEIKDRILLILDFLETCDRHHGAWSHWYNGDTKKTQPFGADDDGGDIVETSFVAQALVALKHYFSESDTKSADIRTKADQLWKEIEWDWYTTHFGNALSWHWSPNIGFGKNMKVSGWNECLGTYIMAAASPTHGIDANVYHQGWARNGNMVNSRTYYGYEIKLARNWGGPLFWIHYAHHGINPEGLEDQYADYWQEHVNTALIHYEYAKANPLGYENYSEKCWGLTASDDPDGYTAHKPMDNDNGTVSPTAALASMPYTPEESMKALKYFYRERGAELFGPYGPYDAFNDSRDWVKESYIGIDQGPIVIMIENHRTGLLWDNVMIDMDVKQGLELLDFDYELVGDPVQVEESLTAFDDVVVYPNPVDQELRIEWKASSESALISIVDQSGRIVYNDKLAGDGRASLDMSFLESGLYIVQIRSSRGVSSSIVAKE